MGATLQALIDLQNVELQIVDIRRQLARRERLVTEQNRKLEALRRSVEAERSELRKTQIQVDELDVDLKARTSHINRLREHLNTVKTNKEYAAVLAQLNNEKADHTRVETRALEMMTQIEARKKAFADQEQSEKAEMQRLADLQAQFQQARQTFEQKLAQLERERKDAASHVERETLVQFERLAERYDGEVLAEVQRTSPRRDEFLCSGCNMSLSAEVANGLMRRGDVQTCRNCGRILFIKNSR